MGESRSRAARLRPTRDGDLGLLDSLYSQAMACDGHVGSALPLAVRLGSTAVSPGSGGTLDLWESLATIAAADVTVARVIEPHVDALAILEQAATVALDGGPDLASIGADEHSTWGVFAAEATGLSLSATVHGDGWRLTGTKPWCSLADRLSHALVTASTGDGNRRLFAVDLGSPGVRAREGVWAAKGLSAIPSGPVDFTDVEAVPVGEDGWYLARPGFAWGGIGVAAVWWGGAVGVARTMEDQARSRQPDQIAEMHLGGVDVDLHVARLALIDAARVVDSPAGGEESSRWAAGILARRTRAIVARAAEDVIARSAHALGPAPLALDGQHAGRVADLDLYLRQHHAERDEAALGRALIARGANAW